MPSTKKLIFSAKSFISPESKLSPPLRGEIIRTLNDFDPAKPFASSRRMTAEFGPRAAAHAEFPRARLAVTYESVGSLAGVGVGLATLVVGVGSGEEVSLADGLGVGLRDGVLAEADCFVTTPLLQTSFLPDLMHVNFLP